MKNSAEIIKDEIIDKLSDERKIKLLLDELEHGSIVNKEFSEIIKKLKRKLKKDWRKNKGLI